MFSNEWVSIKLVWLAAFWCSCFDLSASVLSHFSHHMPQGSFIHILFKLIWMSNLFPSFLDLQGVFAPPQIARWWSTSTSLRLLITFLWCLHCSIPKQDRFHSTLPPWVCAKMHARELYWRTGRGSVTWSRFGRRLVRLILECHYFVNCLSCFSRFWLRSAFISHYSITLCLFSCIIGLSACFSLHKFIVLRDASLSA